MAIDIEAIRKRLNALNTPFAKKSIPYLKFDKPGKYVVRALPWGDTPPDEPFRELRFHYLKNPRLISPSTFGGQDPVIDFAQKLLSERGPNNFRIARAIEPKSNWYLPVAERGKEDEGLKLYGFNIFGYKRLMGFLVDETIQDFMDPETGFDLELTVTSSGKMFNDKPVFDTMIDAARVTTPLSKTPGSKVPINAQALLDAVPGFIAQFNESFRPSSPAELEKAIEEWMAGPGPAEAIAKAEARAREKAEKEAREKGIKLPPVPARPAPAAPTKPTAPAAKPAKVGDDLDDIINDLAASLGRAFRGRPG